MGRYAEYKDSGLEWISEISAHWKTIRFSGWKIFLHGSFPTIFSLFHRNGNTALAYYFRIDRTNHVILYRTHSINMLS